MIAFGQARAVQLPERDYFDVVLAAIESARRRIWAALFIFDIRPSRDLEGQVLELVTALAARRRAGVDVRVLVTGSVETADIAVANLASGLLLEQSGVPIRRVFADEERQGSHAKFVVCDDRAVVGSQNWTDDAFRLNVEDAVLLSGPVADVLSGKFLRLWRLGRGNPRDGSRTADD